MRLPKLSPPVKRPHFIQPYECVDLVNGRAEDLFRIRLDLMHGANYNDPAAFQYPSYGSLKMSAGNRSFYG